MRSPGHDIRNLIKRAKKRGIARDTFGAADAYRVHLHHLGGDWRLVVIPMPPQPEGARLHRDPAGVTWEVGAAVVAGLVGGALRGGSFSEAETPIAYAGTPAAHEPPRLAFDFRWVLDAREAN